MAGATSFSVDMAHFGTGRNKRTIRDRAPSDYLGEFTNHNADLATCLSGHLIDLSHPSLRDDDYAAFFQHRCEVLSVELGKRLISRNVDLDGQAVQTDDLDPLAQDEGGV